MFPKSRILLLAGLCCVALAALPPSAAARSKTLTISQVYGGGGNSGATYTNDFVELHNVGSASINVSAMAVQSTSGTGTAWAVTALGGAQVPAGGYYLVQLAQGSGGTTPLPSPDAVGAPNLSAVAGKVALTSTTAALAGSCPSAAVVDLVGYGTGADCFEGSGGPAPTPSNTTANLRGAEGCLDSDRNAADFATGFPTPRNSASPHRWCIAPQTTITAGPLGLTNDASPSFDFTSDELDASFECSIDSEPFDACSPPKAYADLPDGPHSFKVRATDGENNTEDPPVERRFTVDTIISGSATAKRKQKQRGSRISVSVKVEASERLYTAASGKVKRGRTAYALGPRSGNLIAGSSLNLKLKPARSKDAKRIIRALRRGRRATGRLAVELEDEAGNTRIQRLSVKLR